MNQFTYYKSPMSKKEAQSNVNHWWYIKMGDVPEGENVANWNTYVKSMTQDANRILKSFS